MRELKPRAKLATEANTLSSAAQLVRYRSTTYIPADFETLDVSVPPAPERTIWLPLTRPGLRALAGDMFSTLFATDSELASFDYMVAQTATYQPDAMSSLLIRTEEGLMELNDEGVLSPATGEFRPNALRPMLNVDQADKDRVFAVISGWLDSDQEAESLLSHLATSLAPGWSAVKYILLLGDGRNGKSLMLKMLASLFGPENVANVTRQSIAEQNPVVTELNGKLLNIVYDGRAEYLKDSGTEKSLIAGEPVPIRKLYESTSTTVQTNALFLEGLQKEPKSHDKSSALQKRLVRFQFPNVYPLNHRFERHMLTEETLGAFLSLLVDRYVTEDTIAARLMPTTRSLELQLESMFTNSIGLQFLKHMEETDAFGARGLLGSPMSELVAKFQSWRLKENDLGTWAEPDVMGLFGPLLTTERKSARDLHGQPRKIRVITSYKAEAAAFIESLKGETDDADVIEALVEE
jgi:phage/plasmid-associated DNA primase